MFPTKLLTKWIIGLILSAILTGGIYSVYSHIKQIGYEEANKVCVENFKQYEKDRDEKIANIEESIRTLVKDGKEANLALASDISTIIKSTKGKSLVIVKEGVCTPSPTYSDSITKINERVNQSIKETQK